MVFEHGAPESTERCSPWTLDEYQLLHTFTGATLSGTPNTDGRGPEAGLVQGSDGYLYGSSAAGGANGEGTVFKVSADGSTYVQLYAFTGATIPGASMKDGAEPVGSLVQGSDRFFYGTTYEAGTSGDGTVFKLSADGLTYKQLHSFTMRRFPEPRIRTAETPRPVWYRAATGIFTGRPWTAGRAGRARCSG